MEDQKTVKDSKPAIVICVVISVLLIGIAAMFALSAHRTQINNDWQANTIMTYAKEIASLQQTIFKCDSTMAVAFRNFELERIQTKHDLDSISQMMPDSVIVIKKVDYIDWPYYLKDQDTIIWRQRSVNGMVSKALRGAKCEQVCNER